MTENEKRDAAWAEFVEIGKLHNRGEWATVVDRAVENIDKGEAIPAMAEVAVLSIKLVKSAEFYEKGKVEQYRKILKYVDATKDTYDYGFREVVRFETLKLFVEDAAKTGKR